MLVSLSHSCYAMGSVGNCPGWAEAERCGFVGWFHFCCLLLLFSEWFVLVAQWFTGHKTIGFLLLPGNLIAHAINFTVFDSFFSKPLVHLHSDRRRYDPAGSWENALRVLWFWLAVLAVLALAKLLNWAFLGLQSSPSAVLKAVAGVVLFCIFFRWWGRSLCPHYGVIM